MKQLRERILALGMALCLCLSLCAVPASAADKPSMPGYNPGTPDDPTTPEAIGTIDLTLSLTKSGDNYTATYTAETTMVKWLAKAAAVCKDDSRMKDLRFTCTLKDALTAKLTSVGSDEYNFDSAKYNNEPIFVLDVLDVLDVLNEQKAVWIENGTIKLRYKLNSAVLTDWSDEVNIQNVTSALRQPMSMTATKTVPADVVNEVRSTLHTEAKIEITSVGGEIPFYKEDSILAAYGEYPVSGGGGGGSVTPTTPTITVPVSGDENKVNVSATVSGNNAAVKELTDQEVEKVLGASVETGIVEIDLSGLGTEISSATIPTVTINKIADATKETGNDASGMSVKLSTATVTFDAAATQEISQQANGSTIQLVVDDIQKVSLNTAQKTAVEKLDTALVVDAYLVSNGARLCSESKGGFGGGKATVVLPYEIESNRSAANYSVYYVDDAGKLEKLNAKYDSTLGAFVFDITHFSNYVVAYEKNASAFVDVKTSDYFYNAVLWAAENGITNGVDSTHFGPSAPVTRAQVVTFLWRAAGCPEPKGNAGKFVDVPANDYYAKAVAWAIEQTITKGTSDTTFSPNMVCTRGQIVTFLARFAGVADAETASVFADVQATDYFAAAVKWAKDNKVTEGTSATTFSPKANCTRAQVVTFLYRWMVR